MYVGIQVASGGGAHAPLAPLIIACFLVVGAAVVGATVGVAVGTFVGAAVGACVGAWVQSPQRSGQCFASVAFLPLLEHSGGAQHSETHKSSSKHAGI